MTRSFRYHDGLRGASRDNVGFGSAEDFFLAPTLFQDSQAKVIPGL